MSLIWWLVIITTYEIKEYLLLGCCVLSYFLSVQVSNFKTLEVIRFHLYTFCVFFGFMNHSSIQTVVVLFCLPAKLNWTTELYVCVMGLLFFSFATFHTWSSWHMTRIMEKWGWWCVQDRGRRQKQRSMFNWLITMRKVRTFVEKKNYSVLLN